MRAEPVRTLEVKTQTACGGSGGGGTTEGYSPWRNFACEDRPAWARRSAASVV